MADEKLIPVSMGPGTKHPSHQEIYSNAAKIGFGPWDIRLIFGHVVDTGTNVQAAEDLVTVVMSPQHAKVLAAQWENAIKSYELTFGKIPDLAEAVAKLTAPMQKDTH